MTSERPLSAFQARPTQDLESHLEGVEDSVRALVEDAGETPYGDEWEDVMRTLAWTHDIGKLTEYFQTYINTGDRRAANSTELTYHGAFGGLVSTVVLARQGFSPGTIAAGFYAVVKHHSSLQNVPTDIGTYYHDKSAVDGRYEIAERQLDSIDDTAATAADTVLRRATDDEYGWDDLRSDGLGAARETIAELDPSVFDAEFYGCVLRAWSTLVAADKFDASGLTEDDDHALTAVRRPDASDLAKEIRSLAGPKLPDGTEANMYLDSPDTSLLPEDAPIDQRLTALRTVANGRATRTLHERHAAGDRAFELTLPTGFGKTYVGLRGALELAEQRDSRVIYALPYTSIIDQVDEQIQEVFDVSALDPPYTKHHHLADTRTIPNEEDGFVDDASSGAETLHAESWRSGLVLTTFTQLFESVAGPGNVQSTKLPALQDSVILVDEPQAISHDWWALIGRLTRYLSSEYDATVIFMTATQPKILDRLPDAPTPTPLVDLRTECTELISEAPRVEFDLHESLVAHFDGDETASVPLATAADELGATQTDDTNTLAIVNTVGCAVGLAEALSDPHRVNLADELLSYLRAVGRDSFDPDEYLARLARANPDADGLIASLTTRLRPVDRSALLDALDRILNPDASTPFDAVPTITVSTQLIEAGVDLSFDRLYRDYAPLPSIVQAAGRCNRQFGGPTAPVTVWRLDSPDADDYIPSQLIYGDRSLLRPTLTALSELRSTVGSTRLPEAPVITDGVETYYNMLHDQRKTDTRTDDLVEAFDSAKGRKLRNASLISSQYPTRDVLVLVSDSDVETYKAYTHHREESEWSAARESFQELKETLVSVPVESPPADDSPAVLRVGESDDSYGVTTGRGAVLEAITYDSEV